MSPFHKTPQVTPASCPLSAPVSISSLRPQSDVKHYMCTSCIMEFGRRKIPVLLFNTHVSVLNLTSSYTFLLECAHRVHLFAVPWSVAHKGPLSMISPGKNTGMGSYFLLQGIFPAQGLNLTLASSTLKGRVFTSVQSGKPIFTYMKLLHSFHRQ